jgi:hypothetical protein
VRTNLLQQPEVRRQLGATPPLQIEGRVACRAVRMTRRLAAIIAANVAEYRRLIALTMRTRRNPKSGRMSCRYLHPEDDRRAPSRVNRGRRRGGHWTRPSGLVETTGAGRGSHLAPHISAASDPEIEVFGASLSAQIRPSDAEALRHPHLGSADVFVRVRGHVASDLLGDSLGAY